MSRGMVCELESPRVPVQPPRTGGFKPRDRSRLRSRNLRTWSHFEFLAEADIGGQVRVQRQGGIPTGQDDWRIWLVA